ncbi:MAG: SufS family cysteine desulfurase [Acholeplasmatales bacterium]|nr:SufS family cysteine desulfurase [Acholeplasmatales bacterium]
MSLSEYRKDFPVLNEQKDLHYLDTAASSLKPKCVIDKVDYYYNHYGCNVHRGVYGLSYEATDMYESARETIARFINADASEIVYTRGASASLNLVAQSYGMTFINEGDEIITSELEHHSNFMPWLNVANVKKATVKFVPLTKEGRITVENFKSVLTDKTKLVALTYVSNVMGYITPIKEIIKICHERGIIVSVDAAQAAPHMKIDVKELDCDFLSFSGHKMCGPTGIGVLYGKKSLLDKMPPVEFGGDMADTVLKDSMTFKEAPMKFETGTPIIAGAIGLGEACKYLDSIGLDKISAWESHLGHLAATELSKINGVTVYNPSVETGVVAFNIDGVHPHDAASIYDENHVCIRAGHHCAQLVTRFLNQISTTRASFYFYNTEEDVYALVDAVKKAIDFFGQF